MIIDFMFLKPHIRLLLNKASTWSKVLIGWKSVRKIQRVPSSSRESWLQTF